MHIFAAEAYISMVCGLTLFLCMYVAYVQGGPKMAQFLYALTSSNINRFSKLFRRQNQKKICNKNITKDRITPQVYRYTTL